jgi:hypothetical protein
MTKATAGHSRWRSVTALGCVAMLALSACGGGSDDDADGGATTPNVFDPTGGATLPPTAPEQETLPAATDGGGEPSATAEAGDDGDPNRHVVPDEFATIQAAVDAAAEGDLVFVQPGTYNEAVDVLTNNLTIRGADRNTVILDGQFELDNGVRVLGATGVSVENMTATGTPATASSGPVSPVSVGRTSRRIATATTASMPSPAWSANWITSTLPAIPMLVSTSASASRATR